MDVTADLQSFTALRDWLTAQVAGYLDRSADQIDPAASFAESGLDSMYALMLCGDVEDTFGLPMEPKVAWDNRSIDALAGYLGERLARVPL
ncbi:acyl carrier protein [Allocatelliglobosispora scoriae]|uniref:Acyl carrier protein n=1 Tax=Allocatelliglobosispora scoriae TaxID=643052 RepID=A0A841C4U9_9ACTN|nr:acyl carrier protein [Allocatelliglobosispora scoriae]MBB5874092.1 acyl carrier protein [Allocatelliglobosispora scoriae]